MSRGETVPVFLSHQKKKVNVTHLRSYSLESEVSLLGHCLPLELTPLPSLSGKLTYKRLT